ncbi:tRNA(Glu)-specific nuclease WapA precursor [Pirellula sp. SH-Sr6A]|uniref:RHS repeat domain-containing protein n=1 Tax=Pirellula sp. SH-Sr6A TaxID=1632865 RepID=UPI00078C9616|nr:RHS repeat-associated core domain-containing protein [Pirellula sp. SH-Sr6A]AMV34100.1 tRNA(Glu)-specific nuclease WapA precursor [Pirellula sp. SH-Sr6A]
MSNYGFTSAGTSNVDEDRLTGFARTRGTFSQSWSLTSVGDWPSITPNGTAQNRNYGPTHELLTAGGQNVTMDVKGNITLLPTTLTTSGVAMAVSYDFDNKLKSADVDNNGSNDVTFQYDALGRRVARQGTSGSFVYVQQDQQTIADYEYGDAPSSPTHRYVYASYIDEPVVRKATGTSGTIHYYHRNQQFSITAVTTSSGSVAERYAYTAYGQPTILDGSGSVLSSSAINNRYTYTGREWDQTLGLYHFRARWMSGLAGRFMGRDPIGYRSLDLNLCRFVFNQPMVQLDPHGLKCTTWFLITHGPRGGYRPIFEAGINHPSFLPEFEKCDKIAPICCWLRDGKRVCRERFEKPESELFPRNWPDTNELIDTSKPGGKKLIYSIFEKYVPLAMRECCKNTKKKCECDGKCKARFFCHDDMIDLMEDFVNPSNPTLLPSNPCGKTWTFDCESNSWQDYGAAEPGK